MRVPASGESVTEADVGEWLKKEGDAVSVDEPIVSLETDKAALDVPAPASGVLSRIVAQEGETVEVGALLAVIQKGASAKTNGAAAPSPAKAAPENKSAQIQALTETLSPAPRRVVAERGLDASSIAGTGKGGRVTKGDALAAQAPLSRNLPRLSPARRALPASGKSA